jgi:signal transduction histidine kinase
LYQKAWEFAREGVVIFAEKVLYVNPPAARLLSVERDRLVGKPLLLALRDHRLEALCRLGGEITVEVRGQTLKAKATAGILLLWDTTEEQKRTQALETSSRMLAHEFRTPVAGMLSLLEALQMGVSEEQVKEALAMLYQEAHRLRQLVEDLPLDRHPSRARTFMLQSLQDRLERFLAPQLSGTGSWIIWDLPHSVRANPDAVYQALLNLLDNALKYGPGGEILVVSGEKEGKIWLEVRDKGAPLQNTEILFQPGARGLHVANVRGTGLGLSLVKRLAQHWNGDAYGVSNQAGNAFGLTFPIE